MKVAALFALAIVLCFGFATVQAQSSTYCSLCQFAVQYIDGYLQQNYTQAQIIKQLEVVCALAPEPFADQCDTFVEQYVPVLIDYIVKYEDPSTACTQLRFCGSFDKEAAAKIIDAMKRSQSGTECQLCKMFVGFVATYIEQHKTVGEIEEYLSNLCHLTPFPNQCVEFVEVYTPALVALMKRTILDPSNACKQLNVCSSQFIPGAIQVQ